MRALGKFIWRFMVIFSFIVNFVLVAVLIVAGLFIFEIKGQIADPLIGGLHSTAAGLGEATIDWVIPVRDQLGIDLQVPINESTILSRVTEIGGVPVVNQIPGETVVRLTRPVPISINGAYIDAGNLQLANATVNITLPEGTELPVALDLEVGLVTDIPVDLDVRAVIPLSQTQLNDPIYQLGLLFEPLAIGLHNLPDNFSEAGQFAALVLAGDKPLDELLLSTDGAGFNSQTYDPWFGFSQTAGVGYQALAQEMYPVEARPIQTGIVVPGGIPALDALLPGRAYLYQNSGSPDTAMSFSAQSIGETGIPSYTYDGSYGEFYSNLQGGIALPAQEAMTINSQSTSGGDGMNSTPANSSNTNSDGSGIIPTPTGN